MVENYVVIKNDIPYGNERVTIKEYARVKKDFDKVVKNFSKTNESRRNTELNEINNLYFTDDELGLDFTSDYLYRVSTDGSRLVILTCIDKNNLNDTDKLDIEAYKQKHERYNLYNIGIQRIIPSQYQTTDNLVTGMSIIRNIIDIMQETKYRYNKHEQVKVCVHKGEYKVYLHLETIYLLRHLLSIEGTKMYATDGKRPVVFVNKYCKIIAAPMKESDEAILNTDDNVIQKYLYNDWCIVEDTDYFKKFCLLKQGKADFITDTDKLYSYTTTYVNRLRNTDEVKYNMKYSFNMYDNIIKPYNEYIKGNSNYTESDIRKNCLFLLSNYR